MKRYLFLLLFLASLQYSKAQITRLKFDHFTEKEGLADPQVQFIKQDDAEYIWIGTLTGLVRYDGYSLAYDMVKGHRGSIQVNSVEREGSGFIISLPIT